MAPCTRCGHELEDEAKVCSRCGGDGGQVLTDLARDAPAMTAAGSYLRPFAPPGDTPSVLPDPADEQAFWAEQSGSAWPGQAQEWRTGAHGEADSQAPEPYRQFQPAPVPAAAVAGLHKHARGPSGRWISTVTAAIVVVIAAGGVFLLLHHHASAPPAGRKAASSRTTPPSSQTTPAVAGSQLVSVGAAAANSPQEPAVVSFLSRYFTAINQHDYAAYQRLFSPALRTGLSAADFQSGYGSSLDSRAKLHSITPAGVGQIAVSVTFISHQQVTTSQTQSGCTAWNITLYLAAQGQGFVIVSPPAGYTPTFRDCS